MFFSKDDLAVIVACFTEDVCSLHTCFSADSFHLLWCITPCESSGRFFGPPGRPILHLDMVVEDEGDIKSIRDLRRLT